jgi:hypothetical protein
MEHYSTELCSGNRYEPDREPSYSRRYRLYYLTLEPGIVDSSSPTGSPGYYKEPERCFGLRRADLNGNDHSRKWRNRHDSRRVPIFNRQWGNVECMEHDRAKFCSGNRHEPDREPPYGRRYRLYHLTF